jgi:PIN domain nuclease of toxin-antitoxin system
VRYLLDTQIYLWFLADSRRLSAGARSRIAEAEQVFVSAASIWEASIKIAIGKFEADVEGLVAGIAGSGFVQMPVTALHAARVATLPRHHGDPFDRLLVAQAMHEPLHFLTADDSLGAYSNLVVQAG